ncbi:MAG: hypothetical protein AAF438_20795, partial [Pseudomonadota bacterium]
RHFVLARLPGFDVSANNVSLMVPWLQDPLRDLWPQKYVQASRIQARCLAQGAAVINPVERLSISRKSVSLPLLSEAGVRTAKVVRVDPRQPERLLDDLTFPFILRDDIVHGCPTQLINQAADLREVNWSSWSSPIALEFIDTRSPDGFFRKYRYCLFGENGHNRHLIISNEWYVHADQRDFAEAHLAEEADFCHAEKNAHHDAFNQMRLALGLDCVAFDYGFDNQGQLVVWEPNPFPLLYNPDASYGSSPEFVNPMYQKLLSYLLMKAKIEPKVGSSLI